MSSAKKKVLLTSVVLIVLGCLVFSFYKAPVQSRIWQTGTVIRKPGIYKLARDLSVAKGGVGIFVNSDNVTLDLDHHSIRGENADGKNLGTTSVGIRVEGRGNVKIFNGNIDGHFNGIEFEAKSGSHTSKRIHVQKLSFSNNTARAIFQKSFNTAFFVDLLIENMFGTLQPNQVYTYGIEVQKGDCYIINNHFKNIYGRDSGEGVPISITSTVDRCLIQKNYIENDRYPETGRSIGIWVGDENKNISLVRNKIIRMVQSILSTKAILEIQNELIEDGCPESQKKRPGFSTNSNQVISPSSPVICYFDLKDAVEKLDGSKPDTLMRLANVFDERGDYLHSAAVFQVAAELGNPVAKHRLWAYFHHQAIPKDQRPLIDSLSLELKSSFQSKKLPSWLAPTPEKKKSHG
jgi:hypothetical protein